MKSLGFGAAALGLPASIARALEIPANNATGTIKDVEHIVILTQENRSFDHYFGTLRGVRGFGDRFAIPVPNQDGIENATVFVQPNENKSAPKAIGPFHLNTHQDFNVMRVTGTPHTFPDAQAAWDLGRMNNWPRAKHNHSMGYFTRDDIPFQYALAENFTICDAYHCAMHAGTNPNRLYIFSGTNGSEALNGPALDNGYDSLKSDPMHHGGYAWTTYAERLTSSSISWQVYQDMDDNFTDNPLVGFKLYRMADKAKDGPLAQLAQQAMRTRGLDRLKEDVIAGTLPQVSWIVGTAEGSEHPGPSSPAQGAAYIAKVLDALTANAEVWSKTVFLINFDENDGFFDHMPPPSPPAIIDGQALGHSQIDTTGEYCDVAKNPYQGRPFGLGPRVPLYVISPWSKGGFVNSQVFDHTSIIRFIETRFGVFEPNISNWRRAVCGDLTSCFDFSNANDAVLPVLPNIDADAKRAKGVILTKTPKAPISVTAPTQEIGLRPARPLPYDLACDITTDAHGVTLDFVNRSQDVAVVFHLYNSLDLSSPPQRYTVKSSSNYLTRLNLIDGKYDLIILGPDGFHRHFKGVGHTDLTLRLDLRRMVAIINFAALTPWQGDFLDHYLTDTNAQAMKISGLDQKVIDLSPTHGWYDFAVMSNDFNWRYSGHLKSEGPSFSDPALGGPAPLTV